MKKLLLTLCIVLLPTACVAGESARNAPDIPGMHPPPPPVQKDDTLGLAIINDNIKEIKKYILTDEHLFPDKEKRANFLFEHAIMQSFSKCFIEGFEAILQAKLQNVSPDTIKWWEGELKRLEEKITLSSYLKKKYPCVDKTSLTLESYLTKGK